ncbi:hypothetical protein OQA88_10491 [Cercophora sp. LCS_1]
MRLPYVPNPPPVTTPVCFPPTPPPHLTNNSHITKQEDQAIVSRITARRAPRPLQPLDLTLLHSPPVADGWNSFLGAIRTQTSIPADLREIAISRVAVVNEAWYEWAHHAPLAEAGGVSKEGLEVVKRQEECILGHETPGGLTEKQWAVVCYTDEMTRNVHVRDGTFERLRGLFGEQEVVEITATVSVLPCESDE